MTRIAIASLLSILIAAGCGPGPDPSPDAASPRARRAADKTSKKDKSDEQLVQEAMAMTDLAERAKILEDVVKRREDPDEIVWLKRQLLYTYAELGNIERVEALAKDIPLEEDLEGAEVRNAIAYTYAEKGIKIDKARVLIMESLNALDRMESDGTLPPRKNPEEIRGYFLDTLGWIDHKAGKNREAAAVLEESAKRLDHATIRMHLGEAYAALGDWENAGKAFARAATLEGDDAKKAKDRLEALAKDGKLDLAKHMDAAQAVRDGEMLKEKEARAKMLLRNRMEAKSPSFTLTDFDGKLLDNGKLQSAVTVIDFWASWCAPCKEELPIYQTLYEKYKKEPVNFLAVSVDRYKEEAEAFMKDEKYSFPVAHDDGAKVATTFEVQGIPTIVVIGPCGRINWIHQGFNRNVEAILTAQITTLLGEKGQSCELPATKDPTEAPEAPAN